MNVNCQVLDVDLNNSRKSTSQQSKVWKFLALILFFMIGLMAGSQLSSGNGTLNEVIVPTTTSHMHICNKNCQNED